TGSRFSSTALTFPSIGAYLTAHDSKDSVSLKKQILDLNGDGLVDFVNSGSSSSWSVNFGVGAALSSQPDKLISITNQLGGKTTVTYKPSTAWSSETNPSVMPIAPTVAQIVTDDGRATSTSVATTSYVYDGGKYDFVDKRPLGFAHVTATQPCITGETQCP